MRVPVKVTARNIVLSPAEEEAIRRELAKLETFWDQVTSCRILVAQPNRRARIGMRYAVRIALSVPSGQLVVTRQRGDTVITAIQRAFAAIDRRVEDYARRLRGSVKLEAKAPRGTISRLLPWEGYGFITTLDGREIYFDRNSVVGTAFDALAEGMGVRFAETQGAKGPQASTVARVHPSRQRRAAPR